MYIKPYISQRTKELLPLHVITVGSDFDQKPVHRLGGNPFHHIFFVEKGQGVFETAAGTFTVGEGTVMFMKKGAPIAYQRTGDCFKTGWITFDGPAVESLLTCFCAEDFEQLREADLFAALRDCAKSAERGASAARLSRLCYGLIVDFFERRDRAQKHSALLEAQDFMRRHCQQDLSVAQIAAAVKVSESLLYRLFRAEGTTPVEYLRRCRLECAKRYLLEEPTLRVAEIATLCGFSDSAYFCKVFRDAEGMTPRAYRGAYIS